MELSLIQFHIYKPIFDGDKNIFVDKCPYRDSENTIKKYKIELELLNRKYNKLLREKNLLHEKLDTLENKDIFYDCTDGL